MSAGAHQSSFCTDRRRRSAEGAKQSTVAAGGVRLQSEPAHVNSVRGSGEGFDALGGSIHTVKVL